MKGFKQLALTAAIMAASGSALALEAMDDSALSATTGQDGLTVTIDSSTISDLDITWVDNGGFGTTFTTDGAVLIENLGMSMSDVDIVIDAGSAAVTGAQLNVAITVNDPLTISLNDGTNGTVISVANGSAMDPLDPTASSLSQVTPIVRFGSTASVTVSGGLTANLKLGQRAAGEDLMTLNVATPFDVVLSGGITILDAEATDAAAQDVGISIGTLAVHDVVLSNAINVETTGLVIETAGTSIGRVAMEAVKFGTAGAADIGDVYLSGFDVNSTIRISGH